MVELVGPQETLAGRGHAKVDQRVAQTLSAEPAANRPARHVVITNDFDRLNVHSFSCSTKLKKETRWPDDELVPAASPQVDESKLESSARRFHLPIRWVP